MQATTLSKVAPPLSCELLLANLSKIEDQLEAAGIVRQGARLDDGRSSTRMPTISEFFGVVITMHYRDHGVPHFHARYAEQEASIAIDSLEVLEGGLPARVLELVHEWASMNRLGLEDNWERCRLKLPLRPIDPLD